MTDSGSGREPVIAGWAQLSDHGGTATGDAPTPDEMLTAVSRAALERSGRAERLLAAIDSVGCVDSVSWPSPTRAGSWRSGSGSTIARSKP